MSPIVSVIIVAVLAVFTSVTAPLILARRTERMHHDDLTEQYRREDKVATRAAETAALLAADQKKTAAHAAETAQLLLDAQHQTTRRTEEVARLAAEADAATSARLGHIEDQTKAIHTLVNSEMTAARIAELDQTRRLLVILLRVVAQTLEGGGDADPHDVMAIEAARDRVTELERILVIRRAQARRVEEDEAERDAAADDEAAGPPETGQQ